jgi:hypothetical protein
MDCMKLAGTVKSQFTSFEDILLLTGSNQHLPFIDIDKLPKIMCLTVKREIARAFIIKKADQVSNRQGFFDIMVLVQLLQNDRSRLPV